MKHIWSFLILTILLCFPFGKTHEEVESDFPDVNLLPEDGVPPTPEEGEETIDESAVLVLTEANFEETIRENNYILVEFYARKFLSLYYNKGK